MLKLSSDINGQTSKTLTSFYESQNIPNNLLPNFTFGSIPVDLQKFSNDNTKEITIKCIKISFVLNKDDSIKFICGKSKNNNSKKFFLEWIKDDEIVNLIENPESKRGTFEIFFKKLDQNIHQKEENFIEKNLKELAELEVINAQLILGLLYAKCIESTEIGQDYNKAIELFKKVSEQGSTEGNLCLGYMYSKENSSTYDPQEAFAYYTKAADQGNEIAIRNLAIMHLVGEHAPQNHKNSVKLFKRASNQFGDSVSENILGLLYLKGIGVPKSVHDAAKYFRKASDSNDINAKMNLGLLLYNGEDEVEGVKLFKEAVENGSVEAQMLLAKVYESGKGVECDYEKAFEWYSKVAEYEEVNSFVDCVKESQFCLAKLYEKGLGVEKNLEKALCWYTKSAEKNYLMAQVTLGDIYRNSEVIDEAKALKWYITAAKQDHYQAQFALGELYEKGLLGVKKDENKALQWYKKSAGQGYIMALLRLGIGSDPVITEFDASKKLKMITKLPSVEELEKAGQAPQPMMIDDNDEFFKKIDNLKDGEKLEANGCPTQ